MRYSLLALALAGCMSSASTEAETVELTAQEAWLGTALPVLRAADCVTCHANAGDALGFLAGTTDLAIRDTLLSSGMVELDPMRTSSRILTKGHHAGLALTAEQTSALLVWLLTE